MEANTNRELSFRGVPVPEITMKPNYQIADGKQVIDKISKMSKDQLKNVTVSGIHYDNKNISDVKLSTGEIVSIETAIALAENSLLQGYSAGSTMHGGRFLRTKPGPKDEGNNKSIHDLPQF